MPPRPAPSSARSGSSQRQGSDEERAVKVLERLAAAEDLGAFGVQHQEDRCLGAIWDGLSSFLPSATAPGSPGQVLLSAWLAAVERGMQLAAQQQDVSLPWHSTAVFLLGNLIGEIGNCLTSLKHPKYGDSRWPDAVAERLRVALSVLAVRAGVPKAHEQLSLRLTSILSAAGSSGAAAAQQQQQEMGSAVAKLVADHLGFLTHMGMAWPGGAGLFHPSLCQAVPAAAGLAVAAMRSRDVLIYDGLGTVHTSTRLAPMNFSTVLCNAYDAAYDAAGSGSSVPAQIAESSSVGTLLLMRFGLAAERLHQLQHSLSPVAVGAAPSAGAAGAADAQQQQLAVPAHHTQLLQALGVAAGGVHPNSPLAAQGVAAWSSAVRMLLITAGEYLADAAAAASCERQLLLVLLECALLDPMAQLVQVVSNVMHHVLVCSDVQTAGQLAPPLLRAILEQGAGGRALQAAAPAQAPAAAVADGAAPSVLQVLAILVMGVSRAGVACAINASCTAENSGAAMGCQLAGVAAVWLEHPAQFASLLEAGLRMRKCDLLPSAVSAARTAMAAACPMLSAGSGAMAADSLQQVFALLLSCLKTATVAADKGSGSSSDGAAASEDAEQIWKSAGVVVHDVFGPCCALLFPSSSPGSSSASSSSNASSNQTSMAAPAAAAAAAAGLGARLGCVLLARGLVAAGRLLQQLQAQAPARDSSSRQDVLSDLLNACERAAALLVQQLPQAAAAAAAEPWVPQLLEEHAPLEQQLESLHAQLAAASAGEANPQLPAAVLAGVTEQLQAFGAAVCAALPVQQCCNHHDCSNLEQTSELELVGGKTCVCGGCRVARYCSRECQVAHYKGWHKAVCKRLQAQRQQEAAQQQSEPQQQQQRAA